MILDIIEKMDDYLFRWADNKNYKYSLKYGYYDDHCGNITRTLYSIDDIHKLDESKEIFYLINAWNGIPLSSQLNIFQLEKIATNDLYRNELELFRDDFIKTIVTINSDYELIHIALKKISDMPKKIKWLDSTDPYVWDFTDSDGYGIGIKFRLRYKTFKP